MVNWVLYVSSKHGEVINSVTIVKLKAIKNDGDIFAHHSVVFPLFDTLFLDDMFEGVGFLLLGDRGCRYVRASRLTQQWRRAKKYRTWRIAL